MKTIKLATRSGLAFDALMAGPMEGPLAVLPPSWSTTCAGIQLVSGGDPADDASCARPSGRDGRLSATAPAIANDMDHDQAGIAALNAAVVESTAARTAGERPVIRKKSWTSPGCVMDRTLTPAPISRAA